MGDRGGSRFFFIGIKIFLLVRSPCKKFVMKIVAYISCSAGHTHFARTNSVSELFWNFVWGSTKVSEFSSFPAISEVIFHIGCLLSNQNFQTHFELHMSRPTNVTKHFVSNKFRWRRLGPRPTGLCKLDPLSAAHRPQRNFVGALVCRFTFKQSDLLIWLFLFPASKLHFREETVVLFKKNPSFSTHKRL